MKMSLNLEMEMERDETIVSGLYDDMGNCLLSLVVGWHGMVLHCMSEPEWERVQGEDI